VVKKIIKLNANGKRLTSAHLHVFEYWIRVKKFIAAGHFQANVKSSTSKFDFSLSQLGFGLEVVW